MCQKIQTCKTYSMYYWEILIIIYRFWITFKRVLCFVQNLNMLEFDRCHCFIHQHIPLEQLRHVIKCICKPTSIVFADTNLKYQKIFYFYSLQSVYHTLQSLFSFKIVFEVLFYCPKWCVEHKIFILWVYWIFLNTFFY